MGIVADSIRDFYCKHPRILAQKNIADSLAEAHRVVCERCDTDHHWPWYLIFPLIGWSQWRGYMKLARVRNYLYVQAADERSLLISMLVSVRRYKEED